VRIRNLVMIGLFVVGSVVLAAAPLGCARTAQAQRLSDSRVVLGNGITVLVYPIPGAETFVLEAFQRVGFLDEPKGMIQAAHLLEHLVCQCATKSYKAGEAMRLLNREGEANAETLADCTHYDYALPSEQLELALQVVAERLSSLRIVPEMIGQEAPKCHHEADSVERKPRAGMFKHAFMAFGQAWRHGETKAQVHEGLERISVADLERFYRASSDPHRLALVLIGGFERARAVELLEKYLGSIESLDAAAFPPLPWSQVPKEMTVQWDSSVRAVCISFPPPQDVIERLPLTLWGNVLMQKLVSDVKVQALTDAVFCTNASWGVGRLPFFVYATAKANVSIEQVRELLAARLRAMTAAKPGEAEMFQLRLMASQFTQEPMLDWNMIRRQGDAAASQLGRDPKEAAALVMGNMALQLGMREMLLGADAARAAKAVQTLSADDFHSLLRRTIDPSKGFVTVLAPMGSSKAADSEQQ
jgi:predicted Zn-dependent peptidase